MVTYVYPLLYRLEERGWIKGTWVEKPDERRRRFYKVTVEGRRVLAQQRKTWDAFVEAVRRVTADEHARLGAARACPARVNSALPDPDGRHRDEFSQHLEDRYRGGPPQQ